MTITEALDFIHSVSWLGSKPGLDRTKELLSKLGNPEKNLKFVHIAGTNGKGSVASMLASSLTKAGNTTGLFTSPYIISFNERMQVNCEYISDDELIEITQEIAPHAESMEDSPTEFELVTCMAMLFFLRKNCDIIVLEVGMGGLLDSTNIIESPECSVICSIGLDHVNELGDTLPKIAKEKAGIIKTGCPTVLYQQGDDVMEVIQNVCEERNSPLHITDFSALELISDNFSGQTFKYKNSSELRIPLLGAHQLKNASVALEVIEVLRDRGFVISDKAIADGFSSVHWPARFDIISSDPVFIVDGGHNEQCAQTVYANLTKYFPNKRIVILIGVMADKDYGEITEVLSPIADAFVTVTPNNARALDAAKLAEYLVECYGKPATAAQSIREGVEIALGQSGKDGVCCSVGSLYMVGEVLEAAKDILNI